MPITSAIRKPGLAVRDSRVRKSRSGAGSGLVSVPGRSGELPGGFCAVGVVSVVVSMLLIAFQISLDSVFGVADSVCQFNFRQIMCVQAFDITLVGTGYGLLCLDHFQIVGRSEEHTSELQSLRHLVCR